MHNTKNTLGAWNWSTHGNEQYFMIFLYNCLIIAQNMLVFYVHHINEGVPNFDFVTPPVGKMWGSKTVVKS